MTTLHHQTFLHRCQQHEHWNLNMWRNVIISGESWFWLWQWNLWLTAWTQWSLCWLLHRYGNSFCWRQRWCGVPLLLIQRYWDKILQPVSTISSQSSNSVLQYDNVHSNRLGFIRHYLQNLGVQRVDWPAGRPDLILIEHLGVWLGCALCARVTSTTT